MAKFYGLIGYAETVETVPGVCRETVVERHYSGDIIQDTQKMVAGENLNDNLNIGNMISIVADPYAYLHFHTMRYVSWMGALWKITKVDVKRPRLILTIGGVYNDQQAPSVT